MSLEDFATVLTAKERDIGGFSVRRFLPQIGRKTIGPFVFFDHMGPAAFPPGSGIDVRPHPHIGLATVTYLFTGAILHRDSLGSEQVIVPGDINWMTAGSGIVHSERSPPATRAAGGPLDGLQCWVALPKEHEEMAPAFAHHPARTIPEFDERGVQVRLLVGKLFGRESPARTESDIVYAELRLNAGTRIVVPADGRELGAYVVGEGRLLVAKPGSPLTVDGPAHVMILGGAKLPEPRHIYWNFVSSSQERIERAKADWTADRFPKVPGDDEERIPLPP